MKMLRSRLYELERQKRAEIENAALAQQKKIEWGSQIRNYVLYPYQLVKMFVLVLKKLTLRLCWMGIWMILCWRVCSAIKQ